MPLYDLRCSACDRKYREVFCNSYSAIGDKILEHKSKCCQADMYRIAGGWCARTPLAWTADKNDPRFSK